MAEPSVLYQLIESKLNEPFTGFIAARRPTVSWRSIAREIGDRTGIAVSGEVIRRWFADRVTVEVTVV